MKLISVLSTALISFQLINQPTYAWFWSSTPTQTTSQQKTISYTYDGSGFYGQWWDSCLNIWNFPHQNCPFGEGDVVKCYSRTTTYQIQSSKKCQYTSKAIQLFEPVVKVTTDCRIVDSCFDGPQIDIYQWKYSDWSECSCDGKQTRTVICTNKDAWNSPDADDYPEWCSTSRNSFCGSKPQTSQSCTPPMKKCNNHRYRVSEWSRCSATCGKGTQTRHVVCTDKPKWNSPGAYDDNLWCQPSMNDNAGSKPADTQDCDSGVSCSTFHWDKQEGKCSVTCGQGTKTSTYVCKDQNNQIVDNSECTSVQPKPEVTSCDTGKQCDSYNWYIRTGQCSVTCGDGSIQTQTVCKNQQTGQFVDDRYCSTFPKPVASQLTCHTGISCPSTQSSGGFTIASSTGLPSPQEDYDWQTQQWSSCSATCGVGTQSRDVICVSKVTGRRVNDDHCTTTKPSTNQVCNSGVTCPTTSYNWWTGNYGDCSATCGTTAVKTRQVICKCDKGEVVSDDKCNSATKPQTTETCVGLPSCSGGVVVGDPVFSGLYDGAKYQVHGLDQALYNIISDATTLVNARFTFLNSGRCPVIDGVERRGNNGICYTHPGSYLGEIGVMNDKGDQIYLKPGAYDTGFEKVTFNGEEMKIGDLRGTAGHTCEFVNTHTVRVYTPSFSLLFESSDQFVNLVTKVLNWRTIKAHGLLGQSSSGKIYNENLIKQVQGRVDEYMVSSLFSSDFKYDIYGKSLSTKQQQSQSENFEENKSKPDDEIQLIPQQIQL